MAKRERELACKGRHQQSGGGEVFCSSEFLDTLLVLVTLEVSFFLFLFFLRFVYWDIILPKVSLLIIIIFAHNSTCVEAQGPGKV